MPAETSVSAPAVDQMLCLALHTAARSMTARYRPALAALGLTYPQYLVMVQLWQEGEASVGTLGGRLGLESSTLSPLLKRLEAAALVRRTRSTSDERSVVVSLTERGDGMRAGAAGLPARVCEQAGLDETTQADLVARLRDLVERLGGAGSAAGPDRSRTT